MADAEGTRFNFNMKAKITALFIATAATISVLPGMVGEMLNQPQTARSIGDSPSTVESRTYDRNPLYIEVAGSSMRVPLSLYTSIGASEYSLDRYCRGCDEKEVMKKYGVPLYKMLEAMDYTLADVQNNPYIWFVGKDGYVEVKNYTNVDSLGALDDIVTISATNLPANADKYNTSVGFFDSDSLADDDVLDVVTVRLEKEGFDRHFYLTPDGKVPDVIRHPMPPAKFDPATFLVEVVYADGSKKISYDELLKAATPIWTEKGEQPFIPLSYFMKKSEADWVEFTACDFYSRHALERFDASKVGFLLSDKSARRFGSPLKAYFADYPVGMAGKTQGILKIAFTTE